MHEVRSLVHSLRRDSILARTPRLEGFCRGRVAEVGIITVDRVRISVNGVGELLLIIHRLEEFIDSDLLVSINVETADNCNDLRLASPPTVHPTEIHNVVVVEVGFAAVINCLEGLEG